MRSAGPGDDQARFLADLRALRDTAAIGFDELAARAHYPSDTLKEAENGPYLPPLPILAAYVRACEGNVLDWEERWRRLGDETRADPNLPVRPAGASAAAVAGARAGVGVSPPEAYDPERIKAALRGGHRRPADVSGPTGQPGTEGGGTGWGSSTVQNGGVRRDQQDGSTGWGDSSPTVSSAGWDLGASRDSAAAAEGATSREAGRAWDSGAASQTPASSASGDIWGGSTSSQTPASSASGDIWGGNASRGAGSDRDAEEGWNSAATGSNGRNWDSGAHWDSRGRWDSTASGDATAGVGSSAGWESSADPGGIGLPSGNLHAQRPGRGPFEAAFTQSGDALGQGTVRDERGSLAHGQGTVRDPEASPGYDRGGAQDERARLAEGRPEESAERASGIRTDPFSTSWLQDTEMTSRPDDGRFSWLEPTARARSGESAAPEPGGSEPAGHPGPAPAGINLSHAAGGTPTRVSAERPGATMTATAASQPVNRRRNHSSSWKLLAVVLLAALIGSLLVMMLR